MTYRGSVLFSVIDKLEKQTNKPELDVKVTTMYINTKALQPNSLLISEEGIQGGRRGKLLFVCPFIMATQQNKNYCHPSRFQKEV